MAGPGIDREFERRMACLLNGGSTAALRGGRRGLEKESLRITPRGRIAASGHERGLGSALTHPSITTDYSESLLELVTPTFTDSPALLAFLSDLHQFVYQQIGEECLWASSMPGEITSEAELPIAEYGRSNRGRFKHVYRQGLQTRYGGLMQAIAGVHFNYSLHESFWPVFAQLQKSHEQGAPFITEGYLGLVRNYRRHGWLVPYLFGNSPALCSSFVPGALPEGLERRGPGTLIAPYATSLRMSDVGYRNRTETAVNVSANSLRDYLRDLVSAVLKPHAPYAKLGVQVDGKYRQLNANLLQISNEYYTYIRPKRVPRAGENMCQALWRAGVEYVEVRALDLCAYAAPGADLNELLFVEALLLLLVLKDSPPIGTSEQEALDRNHVRAARQGREPGMQLEREGRRVALRAWGEELLDSMQGICELLDAGVATRPYQVALAAQRAKFADPELMPAARVLRELADDERGHAAWALALSTEHRRQLLDEHRADPKRMEEFKAQAEQSLEEQERIESADKMSFEQTLERELQRYREVAAAVGS
jgi:glutamate--cysteine ligase